MANACAALALGWVTLTGGSGEASAAGEVMPTGKGIAGGILLGAEVVTIPLGLAGVQRGWPYLVFGGLGAVGGGIGGYFVETVTVPPGPSEVPLYMLAGGMALVIPAVVISLNATSYRPPEEDSSEPVTNQPAGEPPAPKTSGRGSRPAVRLQAGATEMAPGIPMSLVGIYPDHISLGIPALTIKSTFTPREIAELGAPKATEVHIPVFQAVF
jgi:hypothetical protein